jgi:3-deoxy-manno-octulosonate cytidylyltransferase (CMP-KDO synthetase)
MVAASGRTRYAIIIPARYSSTRYPGKPLVELRGASGVAKSLINRSWEAAVAAAGADAVWVATDDERIAEAVAGFGGQPILTSSACRNGTERCAEAATKMADCPDIIVNLQGDAPLTPPQLVGQLVEALAEADGAAMTTPALRCSPSTFEHLEADASAGRVGGTTVVFDRFNRALYFSKRILPYHPPGTTGERADVHLHLGVYAYRRQALIDYAAAPASTLELIEGLEQLRFLDQGQDVRVLPLDPLDWDCIELNNPSDAPAIETVLRRRGME